MTAWEITEPCVVDGMPEETYHRDPVLGGSLSSTGARKMLPPSCEALFKWERDHPVYKKEFDYGSAAHKLVLGEGPPVQIIEAADWRTKAAKEERDEAHAAGRIPLLAHQWRQVKDMAAALQEHQLAGDRAAVAEHTIREEPPAMCEACERGLCGIAYCTTTDSCGCPCSTWAATPATTASGRQP